MASATGNWLYYYVSINYPTSTLFDYYSEIYYPAKADTINNALSVSYMAQKNIVYGESWPLLPASSTLYIGQSTKSYFSPFCGQITDIVLITNSYTEAGYEFYLRHGTTGIFIHMRKHNTRRTVGNSSQH